MQVLFPHDFLIGSYWATARSDSIFQVTKNKKAAYLYTIENLPQESRRATSLEQIAFETIRADYWQRVENYLPTMRAVARSFPSASADELTQTVGIKTIISCYRLYNAQRGASFETYARRALYLEYTKHIRRAQKILENLEERAAREENYSKLDARDEVEYLLGKLEPNEAQLLRDYYWGGYTYEQLGDARGQCKANIFLRVRAALKKMKRAARSNKNGVSMEKRIFISPLTGEDKK